MFKFNIDIKTIFILILAAVLVVGILFWPSKGVNTFEDEIKLLNEKNELLNNRNDSLDIINNELDLNIKNIKKQIDSTNTILGQTEIELKRLKNRKSEVHSNVITMGADDVTSNLSDYLKRRH
jgi:predicted PurR-regulated permease PerM